MVAEGRAEELHVLGLTPSLGSHRRPQRPHIERIAPYNRQQQKRENAALQSLYFDEDLPGMERER
jgi:hypothetical protein